MKTIFLTFLISCCTCFGQMGLRSPAFVGAVASRSSFDPATISGFVAWWDSDQGVYSDAGVTPAVNNGTVQRWVPRSGGMNLECTTAANQPMYVTGFQNGHAALSFCGGIPSINTSSNYLTNIWPSAATYAQPNTVFMVAMNTNSTIISTFIDGRTAGARHFANISLADAFDIYSGTADITYGTIDYTVTWLHTVRFDQGSSAWWTNGTACATSASTPGANASDGITVGARYALATFWANMKLCCLLFYNGTMTEGDRGKIENYLMGLYALK